MRRINMGVLLGLAPDWRFDSAMCAIHLGLHDEVSLARAILCESPKDFVKVKLITPRQQMLLIAILLNSFLPGDWHSPTRELIFQLENHLI